ncbi:MAG TPA: XRE family transcriptional regulator [Solirubrobacterales bacterium]|nr:XRE family transcriptional regulator [Solirubrobacterales bacterium]
MPAKTAKGRNPEGEGNGRGGGAAREPLAGPVGERLRAHRTEAGMSLRALARDVGVSPSLISQIEHGKATPSVGTLYAIVSELGISFDELFFDGPRGAAERAEEAPERHADTGNERTPSSHWQAPSEGPVLRSRNRLTLTLATGVRWERLTASHDPGVEFLYCTYPVGGESCPADKLMTHSGSEYGIVLEGRLGATVGDEDYELDPGDSIAFQSTTPHRIWTVGDQPSIAIWTVVGRDGDPRVSG